MSETREARLVWALRLIECQDQGAGGTVTEAEAWRSAQQIAKRALREYAEATPEPPTPEPGRVQSVIARLTASTASLKHVREGITVREGDHISMPLPERPAARCVAPPAQED